MMRFYETDGGAITYGGKNVNEINTEALRRHISYVTQETFLFQDTIENNIKVAKADATREEVCAAAKKAAIHEFIESLPNGYDTKLSELGDSLSGGERQRIGIARAFLHDCPVIFLDEPTSNIDSLNESISFKESVYGKAGKADSFGVPQKVNHGDCRYGYRNELTKAENCYRIYPIGLLG